MSSHSALTPLSTTKIFLLKDKELDQIKFAIKRFYIKTILFQSLHYLFSRKPNNNNNNN